METDLRLTWKARQRWVIKFFGLAHIVTAKVENPDQHATVYLLYKLNLTQEVNSSPRELEEFILRWWPNLERYSFRKVYDSRGEDNTTEKYRRSKH